MPFLSRRRAGASRPSRRRARSCSRGVRTRSELLQRPASSINGVQRQPGLSRGPRANLRGLAPSGSARGMTETRKLAASLVADVVGYSRLAGADEDRTLSRLRGLRSDLIDPAIAAHRGRVVKRTGDGSIIEFRSVVDAVRCAIEVQNGLV